MPTRGRPSMEVRRKEPRDLSAAEANSFEAFSAATPLGLELSPGSRVWQIMVATSQDVIFD